MSAPLCYWNGRLVPADAVAISPYDRGLLLGDGVFETMRAYDGRLFGLAAHLARLQHGAAVLGLDLPADCATALPRTLAANGWREAVLRLTVTRGPAPADRGGLLLAAPPPPTVLVTGRSLAGGAPYPARFYTDGLALATVGPPRNEQSPLSGCKSLNYGDQILARQAAARAGADEALQCNSQGAVVGASVANVFLVRAGTLYTPAPASGCLPGVTRAVVLDLARAAGLACVEGVLAPADFAAAAEAFLTNTLLEIAPVRAVDGRVLPAAPGPITRVLQQALAAACRGLTTAPEAAPG